MDQILLSRRVENSVEKKGCLSNSVDKKLDYVLI